MSALGVPRVPQSAADSIRTVPEFLVGNGFYKLGYVTTDRERALTALREQYGFEDVYRFEPDLEVETADGGRGRAHLQCAFTMGHNIIIEVMQPIEGLVGIFRDPLCDSGDFDLQFHHVGVMVDDFDSADTQMQAAGLPPLWACRQKGVIEVSYNRVPLLGHLVEIVEYSDPQKITTLRGVV